MEKSNKVISLIRSIDEHYQHVASEVFQELEDNVMMAIEEVLDIVDGSEMHMSDLDDDPDGQQIILSIIITHDCIGESSVMHDVVEMSADTAKDIAMLKFGIPYEAIDADVSELIDIFEKAIIAASVIEHDSSRHAHEPEEQFDESKLTAAQQLMLKSFDSKTIQ